MRFQTVAAACCIALAIAWAVIAMAVGSAAIFVFTMGNLMAGGRLLMAAYAAGAAVLTAACLVSAQQIADDHDGFRIVPVVTMYATIGMIAGKLYVVVAKQAAVDVMPTIVGSVAIIIIAATVLMCLGKESRSQTRKSGKPHGGS